MKFDIALKIKAKHGKLQKFIDKIGWTQSEFAIKINYKNTSEVGKRLNICLGGKNELVMEEKQK
jgi:hypothetical protein